jgi:putative ABC transport system permease protein
VTAARVAPFQRQVLDALRAQPHVRAAAWSAIRPMAGAMIAPPLIEGYTPAKDEDMSVQSNIVSTGYFDAMEIPVQSGRAFSEQETSATAPVTIINEAMARKYWAGRNAVGGRISFETPGAADPKWITVVGVAGDARRNVGDPASAFMYLPAAQSTGPFGEMDYLIVRADGDPENLAAALRATLHGIDPTIPVTKVTTMRSHVDATLMAHQLGLRLFALFAGLSVVLTGFGLYAVVASAVASRTREIGIRVALGAGHPGVMRLVVKQGLVPVFAGLIAGLAVSSASAKLIAGFMFSLPALTPGTVAALVAGVGLLAFLAMLFPARRALAIDPAITLRTE